MEELDRNCFCTFACSPTRTLCTFCFRIEAHCTRKHHHSNVLRDPLYLSSRACSILVGVMCSFWTILEHSNSNESASVHIHQFSICKKYCYAIHQHDDLKNHCGIQDDTMTFKTTCTGPVSNESNQINKDKKVQKVKNMCRRVA